MFQMRKKIIILVPSLVGHGMERMAVLASDVLSKEYDVCIVIFSKKELFYKTKVDIISLELPSRQGKINKVFQLTSRVLALKKLCKRLSPDIIFSFGTSANYVNVLSGLFGGKGKSLVSFRGFATVKKGFGFDFTCKYSDGIICISQEMKYELLKIYPQYADKTYYVYNAIDSKHIANSKNEVVDFKPTHPAFVSIGRLEKVKGYSHLLNSFAITKHIYPQASLTIIGDGSEKDNLIKQSLELGIDSSVNFIGAKSNPFAYINQCDICVQTSITEGFMNVIVEAGLCGKPVISSACKTGPKEILSGSFIEGQTIEDDYLIVQNGILVPGFNSNDSLEPDKDKILSNAMCRLWEDKNLLNTLSENIRSRSMDFSLENYQKNLISLLENFI